LLDNARLLQLAGVLSQEPALSGPCDELKAEEKRRSRQFGNGV
jgi:hypothetical protein